VQTHTQNILSTQFRINRCFVWLHTKQRHTTHTLHTIAAPENDVLFRVVTHKTDSTNLNEQGRALKQECANTHAKHSVHTIQNQSLFRVASHETASTANKSSNVVSYLYFALGNPPLIVTPERFLGQFALVVRQGI
jgi:hypothetical protein